LFVSLFKNFKRMRCLTDTRDTKRIQIHFS